MMGMTMLGLTMITSSPELGKAQGQCRAPETGPAIIVHATGLKDRSGLLRIELYPAVDGEFLADDNILIEAGKTFARADIPVPAAGEAELCIRVPRPGRYALSLLHDRNANLRFDPSQDGIGFPNNPKLGWSKPRAADAAVMTGAGIARIAIRLNYRRGFAMRPLEGK